VPGNEEILRIRLHSFAGDERLLDLGRGRGADDGAQHLPRGQAVGIDVWRTTDQSSCALKVTCQNAHLKA
jgi:arsenite methyltransferase